MDNEAAGIEGFMQIFSREDSFEKYLLNGR
jgi:hypothetical protein